MRTPLRAAARPETVAVAGVRPATAGRSPDFRRIAAALIVAMTAACGAPEAARPAIQPADRLATSPASRGAGVPADPATATAPATTGVTTAPVPRRAPMTTTPATATPAPLRVRLGAPCVVPGGVQHLVVETLPRAFVAYDNLYADGRDGRVHGGADGRARSDATGRFTATWQVAVDTPAGEVRLDVGASAPGGAAVTSAHYRVSTRCT